MSLVPSLAYGDEFYDSASKVLNDKEIVDSAPPPGVAKSSIPSSISMTSNADGQVTMDL